MAERLWLFCHVLFSGFSRQTVALLNECGTKFSTFNILADDEVRQGTCITGWMFAGFHFQTLVLSLSLCRTKEVLQLAHISTAVCKGGITRWTGHSQGVELVQIWARIDLLLYSLLLYSVYRRWKKMENWKKYYQREYLWMIGTCATVLLHVYTQAESECFTPFTHNTG